MSQSKPTTSLSAGKVDDESAVKKSSKYQPPRSLREAIAALKGNLLYKMGESFMLHVFWEAPSLKAANELLAGLQQCATATDRDTP